MWINRPGYSAGACNGGPLPVGSWWPRARADVRALADQLALPAAGHGQRLPPLGLAAPAICARSSRRGTHSSRGKGECSRSSGGEPRQGTRGRSTSRCRSFAVPTRWRVRCCALCCCSVRQARPRPRRSFRMSIRESIPRTPQPLKLGPVPDIRPVRGQDRTPRVLKGCVRSRLPAGVAGVDPRGTDPLSPNPLRGLRWYVDPVEPAYRSYRTFVRKHRGHAASLMWRIAREPRFRWFGRWDQPGQAAGAQLSALCRGGAARRRPVDGRDAPPGQGLRRRLHGRRSRRGRRTRAWYRDFARAVGGARVVIGFEPDSLGTVDCLDGEPARRPPEAAALWRQRSLPATPRDDLSRSRGLRLGARPPHRQAAPLHRHPQGPGLHAERDPPRLDPQQHPARARHLPPCGRQALHRQHLIQRPRPDPHPRSPDAKRVVQPSESRTRDCADHKHGPPAGGRLHVDQPAGLLGGRMQRRAAAGGQLVAGARADVRALADQLARHRTRTAPARPGRPARA